jgi:hypothetical protein
MDETAKIIWCLVKRLGGTVKLGDAELRTAGPDDFVQTYYDPMTAETCLMASTQLHPLNEPKVVGRGQSRGARKCEALPSGE